MSAITRAQVVQLRKALNQAIKAISCASEYLTPEQQAEVDRFLDGHEGLNIYVVYSTTATENPDVVEHLVQCNRASSEKEGAWRAHRQWRQELREVREGLDLVDAATRESLELVERATMDVRRRLDVAENEVMRKTGLE